MHILAIYGSLRERSTNKALALAAQKLSPDGMTVEPVASPVFSIYSEDIEKSAFPDEVVAFKKRIEQAAGVLFATPEYNRSLPGGLKNMIDWTSRPSGSHPWKGKPIGVIGASSGDRGTISAQYDLKRMMNYFGAHVLGQPEFYLNATGKFDDAMNLVDEKTKEALKKYLNAFKEHIECLSK